MERVAMCLFALIERECFLLFTDAVSFSKGA